MDRHTHAHPGTPTHGEAHAMRHEPDASGQLALTATLHCLAGCAIGEIAGLVIGTALGWGNGATIVLAIVLAFMSGFALTSWPLLRHGVRPRAALRIALAADTASISIMELVDNGVMLLIPGAMDAPVASVAFWLAMALSLAIAGVAAYPVNRWLIARGRGHAVVHGHH